MILPVTLAQARGEGLLLSAYAPRLGLPAGRVLGVALHVKSPPDIAGLHDFLVSRLRIEIAGREVLAGFAADLPPFVAVGLDAPSATRRASDIEIAPGRFVQPLASALVVAVGDRVEARVEGAHVVRAALVLAVAA